MNDGVNQLMVRTALEWLDIQPQDRVLDLFAAWATLPAAGEACGAGGWRGRVPALVVKARERGVERVT